MLITNKRYFELLDELDECERMLSPDNPRFIVKNYWREKKEFIEFCLRMMEEKKR